MTQQEALFQYTLRLADNALVLGHRVSEWCGHGPVLEQDMALTNIALDLIGQARSLYQYAAKVEGKGHTEDDLAYLREIYDYKNLLLLEQPNGDYARTIARQFLFDTYNYYFHRALCDSKDEQLAAIAAKSLKEITYHLRYSSEWMLRLGDGTVESHQRLQQAVDDLWKFTGELHESDEIDNMMLAEGIGVDLSSLKKQWEQKVGEIITEATLKRPEEGWMHSGGKQGTHTEHLGYLLAELQYLQRMHPGAKW